MGKCPTVYCLDDTSSAANAGQAGKTTVENNFLYAEKIITFVGEFANAKTPAERKQLQHDIDKPDKKLQSQAERMGNINQWHEECIIKPKNIRRLARL
nr:VENN motif pre-toxin domain-containing protein [Providencia sp. wls1949]